MLRNDEVHRLVGSAAAVWDLLESPRTLDELLDDLAGTFTAEPRQLRRDVEALLVRLQTLGAVVEVT